MSEKISTAWVIMKKEPNGNIFRIPWALILKEIIYPCPNFNSAFTKPLLKLGMDK